MIFFGIPLRSKESSVNWDIVSLLFNRTVSSLYNQINPEFRIIIACHEIPKLTKVYDSRVEFIPVDAPIPKNFQEQMIDKSFKIHAIGVKIREYGCGYTLLADADDLYSNRISEYVALHPTECGWVIKTGYDFNYNKNVLKFSLKHPPQPIVKYFPEDLPISMSDALSDSQLNLNLNANKSCKYLIKRGHGNIESECKRLKRKLQIFPFIAHVYVKYSGENHSILSTGHESYARLIFRFLMPEINLKNNYPIKNEFSIDWI